MTRDLFTTRRHNSVSSIKDWYSKHKCMGLQTKNCGIQVSKEHNLTLCNCSSARVFSVYVFYFSFPDFFIIQRFVTWCFSIYFVYVLLFSIAINIVFVVLIISHGYSLPLSKLFCLKDSLNLKERWSNFLEVFGESCTFKMVQYYTITLSDQNFSNSQPA